MTLRYIFDRDIPEKERPRIQDAVQDAFDAGQILSCRCPTPEVRIFETRLPDFQASISCSCDLIRPLFSSTPETEEEES
jgi:hypothetical protein